MNFFKKNGKAYVSLERDDVVSVGDKLWIDLQYALTGENISHVVIRLSDCDDLALQAFSAIAALGLKFTHAGIPYSLECSPKLLQIIKKLNFSAAFSELTEAS